MYWACADVRVHDKWRPSLDGVLGDGAATTTPSPRRASASGDVASMACYHHAIAATRRLEDAAANLGEPLVHQ